MYEMTESQATNEGLTVVPGLPVTPETAVDRMIAASLAADVLAAKVETLLSAGKVQRSDLQALSDGLGYLHVELDELAEERRLVELDQALTRNGLPPALGRAVA